MVEGSGEDDPTPASGAVNVRRVEAVVNAASGSVGAGAAEALEQILSSYSVAVRVANAAPHQIDRAVRAAVDAAPDLVVILAGDGTAGLAARLAGVDGPLIAPLPGGTMNMLPHALYGPVNWRDALCSTLSGGVVRPVSGGEVGGKTFYVAAILGAPALWADAREAVRARRLRLAWLRAKHAMRLTFSGKLHYRLGGEGGEDDDGDERTEALTLMCPLISRGISGDDALEAAALNPKDAIELLRLGFNAVTGSWRADPSVHTTACTEGEAWARRRIPAVLDGEPMRLDPRVSFKYLPTAFRALAPAPIDGGTPVDRATTLLQAPLVMAGRH